MPSRTAILKAYQRQFASIDTTAILKAYQVSIAGFVASPTGQTLVERATTVDAYAEEPTARKRTSARLLRSIWLAGSESDGILRMSSAAIATTMAIRA